MDLIAELLALVAPPVCAACRAPLRDPRGSLCAGCLARLPWLKDACSRCGLPEHRRRCPAAASALVRTWAPLAYEGVARDLMRSLKFRGQLRLAGPMGAQMAANLPRDLRRAGATVVAVPAHSGRRRRRGHDPAGALAAQVASRTGMPAARCLERIDAAPGQIGAGRAERLTGGRLAVRARGAVPARVLLVDDVHTTGATLETCARALRGAGAEWVAGVAYARTL